MTGEWESFTLKLLFTFRIVINIENKNPSFISTAKTLKKRLIDSELLFGIMLIDVCCDKFEVQVRVIFYLL